MLSNESFQSLLKLDFKSQILENLSKARIGREDEDETSFMSEIKFNFDQFKYVFQAGVVCVYKSDQDLEESLVCKIETLYISDCIEEFKLSSEQVVRIKSNH